MKWPRAFYDLNYEMIAMFPLWGQKKIYLPEDGIRRCRFCLRAKLDGASFRMKAHAVPESVGNSVLFTRYECDNCNQRFGETIENDLANYLKPYRTLALISGKTGVPSIKSRDGNWKFEGSTTGIKLSRNADSEVMNVDRNTRSGMIHIPRDPFTPLNVYKALVKMGLSVMPPADIPHFPHARAWLNDEIAPAKIGALIMESHILGWAPGNLMACALLRRKWKLRKVPHMMFVLFDAQMLMQIALPNVDQDSHLFDKALDIPHFPLAKEVLGEDPDIKHSIIDFSSNDVARDSVAHFEFRYESVRKVTVDEGDKA